MFRLLIASFVVSLVLCDENAKIEILNQAFKTLHGEIESEVIAVELKKPDEDIRFVANVRIHLVEGNIHINGHRLEHNVVHHIQMMVQVSDIIKGVKQKPQNKAVQLRVMVEETNTNGVRRLLVEEEFVAIGESTVEQIDVHQIIYESEMRKPTTLIKLSESKIHSKPRVNDHRMFIHDEQSMPHLPKHGLNYENDEEGEEEHGHHHGHHDHDHHRCHKHNHDHHHGNSSFVGRHAHSAKCWYRTLSWKSKVLLFSIGFFGLLTAVMCCGLCAKRRQARRRLEVSAPMDDSVNIDYNEDTVKDVSKKMDDNKMDFHFEFDNKIVVDDKKPLVEEA